MFSRNKRFIHTRQYFFVEIRKMVLLCLIVSCVFITFSQDLQEREIILEQLLSDLRSAKTDQAKMLANKKFKTELEHTILMRGSFEYPFNRLKTIGTITSSDTTFRLFNWNVEQDDLTQKYYCYILKVNNKKDDYHLIELTDNSFMLPPRPNEILTPDNWYGALYYQIIPIKRNSKTLYTVLGWDGNNSMSTVKIIDVLSFSNSSVRLGSPIFKVGKDIHKRIFFEFAKKTTMYMSYEPQYERIVFDHLSPEAPSLEGMYSMYLPDLSYDAFVAEKGRWNLVEDVVAINKKENEYVTISYIDDKTGNIKSKKVKNKWEKPSESHVATLPEEIINEDKAKNNNFPPQTGTTNKQKSRSYNPVDGSGKKYTKNKFPKKKKRSKNR